MRALIVIFILNLFFSCTVLAQSAGVRKQNLYYKDQKAIINYDLKQFQSKKNQSHSIELFFIDDKFNIRLPKKLAGDYGDSVSAGKSKQIQWALFDDDVNLTYALEPIILVDGLHKGGSNNVFLSLLVPGLGDYFVENPRNMIFKPYLRTITALGSIALGVIAGQKRVDLIWKSYSTDIGPSGLRVYSEYGVTWESDNWLFDFDKEIFYFVGISIWVMDILWVYAKGSQNERLKTFTKYNPSVSLNNGFTNFGLNIKL